MVTLQIGTRVIGDGQPSFVIAEAGVNHNGSLDLALKLVEAAAAAGADAVKFQTFKAADLATDDAPKAAYQLQTTEAGESQRQMLQALELSAEAHSELQTACRARGILFLSTPFDVGSVELLDALSVPAFKISSGDLTNLPFLASIARRRKPMLVSTGMATLSEVADAVRAIQAEGLRDVVLLQCTSAYPAEPRDANLRVLQTLRNTFGLLVGYSDHTTGLDTALAAVALGACVIEKHLTLDRQLPGPDHAASLEPAAFTALVRGIRSVESALGDGRKVPAEVERDTAAAARKSLVAARDLAGGAVLTEDLIAIARPGTGLPPAQRKELIGRTLRVPVAAGTLFTLEMLR